MFIIWGYRTIKSKLKQVPELTCPVCGNNHSIQIQYYQQYFHLMWIPYFPSGRKGVIICPQCGHTADPKEIRDKTYWEVYKKHQPKIVKWTWFGLALTTIVTLFILGGTLTCISEKEKKIQAMVDDCRSEMATGKIYQVGVSDTYQIDPSVKSPTHAKVIMIESVEGNTINYYEGRIVGKTYENMLAGDPEKQIETKVVKQITSDDFNKLRIVRCK